MKKLEQVWMAITTPRATDPDQARGEYMTRVIASMTAATLLLFSLVILAGFAAGAFDLYTLVRLAPITLPAIIAWWLAYRGRWHWSAFILPAIFWGNGLQGTLLFGLSAPALFYAIGVLLAGILLGTRAQWTMVVLSVAGYLAAGWLYGDHDMGSLVPQGISISGELTGVALLQQFSTGQLHRALQQSRTYGAELARSNAILTSLSQVAARIETTPAPDQVLVTLGTEMQRLGITCFLAQLDPASDELVARYTSVDPGVRSQVEELVGVDFSDFRLSAHGGPIAPVIGPPGQTLFVPDLMASFGELFPNLSGTVLAQFAALLGVAPQTPALYLPLKAKERLLGVLAVWGGELREQDAAALSVFGNQVAVALENARLVQDLEQSLEQLRQTQGQLAHAQKMEAIGRLAGGIAHDFNNLLTIVQLSARLLSQRIHARDPLLDHVREIQQASERGTHLVKQLLSFSRREAVEPLVLNLSRTVSEMSRMLQRIIGEDIELVALLAQDLWPIKADPAQIEQLVINLAINARDAMPDGGRLVISTANVILEQVPPALRLELGPGDYVTLCVTDAGIGMDEDTVARAFEPFFTTKQRGYGTGLGLPTVYGIVRQHGGAIQLHSAVGQGTKVEIYMPRTLEAVPWARSAAGPAAGLPLSGAATVLIVEDEVAVRRLAQRILEEQGYRVLTAGNGAEALEVSQVHPAGIDLVLTDLVMPQMNGRELVKRLAVIYPHIRVLYMSGYNDDILAYHDMPEQGVAFMAKPFSLETLTERVRLLLEEVEREQGSRE